MYAFQKFARLFPAYEDVFDTDVHLHQQHFLPLVSINLRAIYPDRDEWLHIVSVKAFYDGRVGESKEQYHTPFTQPDIIGFDVISGKYRFEADWRYFENYSVIPEEQYASDFPDQQIEYNMNEAMYQLKKGYFEQYGQLYEGDFNRPGLQVNDIRRLERLRALTPADLKKDVVSDYLAELHQERPAGIFTTLAPEAFPDDAPIDPSFEYIGTIDGSEFQHTAPDSISLFYSPALHKATVIFGNT
ncbi:hypothetical protein [Chitinophaga varians]|uniref:hypothetical protein n=1 Tax=Chitinophaga varians TaxID=2202339 RepID=UPI00165F0F56|nr:hypothetical protein [Chitinophaga varians]MBC9909481.1 hypothetical protein [Chitinophaga varians]